MAENLQHGGADFAFSIFEVVNMIARAIGEKVEGAIDQGVASTDKHLTGYDTDGDKIGRIYRQTMDIGTESSFMAQNSFNRYEISYDYHIVNGQKRILSVAVNGKTIADYYAYE